ncbi:WXG100 family type VII secretion target [Streptomyces sp. NPDC002446]
MSGSGGFKADVEELSSLSARLERCTESMTHASGDLHSATFSELGSDPIDRAGAKFKNSWEYGISQISEITKAIRQDLHATARAYHETDNAVRQAFAKGHPGDGPGNSGEQASPFG